MNGAIINSQKIVGVNLGTISGGGGVFSLGSYGGCPIMAVLITDSNGYTHTGSEQKLIHEYYNSTHLYINFSDTSFNGASVTVYFLV